MMEVNIREVKNGWVVCAREEKRVHELVFNDLHEMMKYLEGCLGTPRIEKKHPHLSHSAFDDNNHSPLDSIKDSGIHPLGGVVEFHDLDEVIRKYEADIRDYMGKVVK